MKRQRKTKRQSELEEIAVFGGFRVLRFKAGEYSYLRVASRDDSWGMDFREDNARYGWLSHCLAYGGEGVNKAVEMWIILSFHLAHVWPDPELLSDVAGAFERLGGRVAEIQTEDTRGGDKTSE